MECVKRDERRPLVGILGGMGPAATADFYAKLVRATPAVTDQQHLRVVIWSDPTVPDRAEALLGRGPDPTPWLVRGARVLRDAGADLIAVPCNTAHAFLPGVAELIGVPIVHMIDEVAGELQRAARPVRKAGLLATSGTLRAGLYRDRFTEAGIELVEPDDERQRASVMPAIRAIKAGGRDAVSLLHAARELVRRGAEVIVAGCAEIPLVLDCAAMAVPVVDPARVLADAVVARAALMYCTQYAAQ